MYMDTTEGSESALVADIEKVPSVSVLMPLFNGSVYVRQAIESILDQTFGDFELLVLNDGSTDASLKVVQEYTAQEVRMRVISRENRGLTYTLNELVSLARAPLIARMDADDIAMPRRLEIQVDFLARNPDIVCVGGACQIIDDAGRYLTTQHPPTADKDIQALMLQGHCAITHPAATARLAAVRKVGGYDSNYDFAEDIDLWLRLGELGKLANMDDVVLKYRIHSKSVSARRGALQRSAARRACESAWKRRGIAQSEYTAAELWRPGADRESQFRHQLTYGWWAWNSGERRTAQIYGLKSVIARPLAREAWKLLVIAYFRRSNAT